MQIFSDLKTRYFKLSDVISQYLVHPFNYVLIYIDFPVYAPKELQKIVLPSSIYLFFFFHLFKGTFPFQNQHYF